jgi:hypothetical protein
MVGGIRSLGELDFVEGCRSRGLPEPESQTLHQAKNGTFYLDFRWPRYRVVVEVDGIHHTWISEVVADALRQNAVTLEGDTVLRLPAIGLRLCPDEFFAQVTSALAAAGCRAAQQLIARSGQSWAVARCHTRWAETPRAMYDARLAGGAVSYGGRMAGAGRMTPA